MKTLMVIFLVLATIFSIGTLLFVAVDFIIEKKQKKEESEDGEAEIVPEVIPVVSAPVVLPQIVSHVDAEEVDEMLSDENAMALVIIDEKSPVTEGYKTYINVDVIDACFESGETVTLEALKEKGLITQKAKRVKILAHGTLTKPLTVKAHSFSIQAIKMIELTGGTVIKLR